MLSRSILSWLVLLLSSHCCSAGIIDDLADGEHLWTSVTVGIDDSLLEMSDSFDADGDVSFDYEFRHFVPFGGQTHRAHSGAGKIDIGTNIDAVSYTYDQAEKTPNSDVFRSGVITNLSVETGETFFFSANTLLTNTFNLSQTVTLEITNFVFTPAASEELESSAVPETSALILGSIGLCLLVIRSRRKHTGR